MIHNEKAIVCDIDGTLCPKKTTGQSYDDIMPHADMVARLLEYRAAGFYIILHTSRNMNTFDGNIGLINANTAKHLFRWLDRHEIPYDELQVGKPWPGRAGFYVDDRTIRPDEFLKMSYEEVLSLIGTD